MDAGTIHPIQSLAAAINTQPAEQRTQQRELIQAIRAVNQSELLGQNNELTFVIDRDTKRPVVKIVDRTTGEVLDQIPPQRVLRMARDLGQQTDTAIR